MSDGEGAFFRAMMAAPADDSPRLVYADWLLERGEARGELIHVQCELARIEDALDAAKQETRDRLRARERALLEEHQRRWLGTPFVRDLSFKFDRGFPTGAISQAGLFIGQRGDRSFSCVRFFFDGGCVSASIGAEPSPSTFVQVGGWLDSKRKEGKGTYKVDLALQTPFAINASGPPTVIFDSHWPSPDRNGFVRYTGAIEGDTLRLTWRSTINGASGDCEYRLEPASNCLPG